MMFFFRLQLLTRTTKRRIYYHAHVFLLELIKCSDLGHAFVSRIRYAFAPFRFPSRSSTLTAQNPAPTRCKKRPQRVVLRQIRCLFFSFRSTPLSPTRKKVFCSPSNLPARERMPRRAIHKQRGRCCKYGNKVRMFKTQHPTGASAWIRYWMVTPGVTKRPPPSSFCRTS